MNRFRTISTILAALLLAGGVGSNLAPTTAWVEAVRTSGDAAEEQVSAEHADLSRARTAARRQLKQRMPAAQVRDAATCPASCTAHCRTEARTLKRLHNLHDLRNGAGLALRC